MKIFYAFLACFWVSLYCADRADVRDCGSDLDEETLELSRMTVFVDVPGARTKEIPVNPYTILAVLVNLMPGKDRHAITYESAIKPAGKAVIHMLRHSCDITTESLSTLNLNSIEAKGLMVVLSSALRLKYHREIENSAIMIGYSGIKGFTPGIWVATAMYPCVYEEVSWDTLNDLCRALTGGADDVFSHREMLEIAERAKKPAVIRKDAVDVMLNKPFVPIVKEAAFAFAGMSGAFSVVNLAASDVEGTILKLVPGQDRTRLSNPLGLTPARRFIDRHFSKQGYEISSFESLTSDTDFNGFMVTVAAYFRYLEAKVVENANVRADTEKRTFTGRASNGRDIDTDSTVQWDEMLKVFETVKSVAGR